METRRKAEEIKRLKQEQEDRNAALALQAQLEKEAADDAKYRQQLEQERRDHELALRLASESNGQVEDSPPLLRKYAFFFIIFITVSFCTYSCIHTNISLIRCGAPVKKTNFCKIFHYDISSCTKTTSTVLYCCKFYNLYKYFFSQWSK